MRKIRTAVPWLPVVVLLTNGWTQPAGAQVTWRVTGVLLIDQAPKTFAFSFQGREEATPAHECQFKIGNWDPRTRVTTHTDLALSRVPWRFSTGVHEWAVSPGLQRQFRHHIFLVDRPAYHAAEGKEKERVLREHQRIVHEWHENVRRKGRQD